MSIADADVMGLWIAALGGAAVGIERQWSGHAEGLRARFAGIRTFSLIGGLGGLSGALWSLGISGPAVVVLSGTAALCVAAYVAASRSDVDGTTEVAALVVLTSGVLAGLGSYRLASGIIAVTCLLLVEKSRLHSLVARIDDVALRAGVRFGVMALVVLPLLPEGPYGPFGGIRPRELWALALFFSGLSFLGYVARRMLGPDPGILRGGPARRSRLVHQRHFHVRPHEPRGARLGWRPGLRRNRRKRDALPTRARRRRRSEPAHAALVARYLALPALAAVTAAVVGLRRSHDENSTPSNIANPLQLKSALQMAFAFQAMLMLVHLAGTAWGSAGVYGSAAVLGLTDVDALTVSMARGFAQAVSLDTAAVAIAIGVLANTGLKLDARVAPWESQVSENCRPDAGSR